MLDNDVVSDGGRVRLAEERTGREPAGAVAERDQNQQRDGRQGRPGAENAPRHLHLRSGILTC